MPPTLLVDMLHDLVIDGAEVIGPHHQLGLVLLRDAEHALIIEGEGADEVVLEARGG